MNLSWIISDGEAGAGRAALDWAISHGIPHAGWCPKGRIAEDGVIPSRYHLKKARTSEFAERAGMNILDSDGTVIITFRDKLQGGLALTAVLAKKHRKPCLQLHNLTFHAGRRLARFICEHHVKILHIAGSRASEEPGVGAFVKATLDEMLQALMPGRKKRP